MALLVDDYNATNKCCTGPIIYDVILCTHPFKGARDPVGALKSLKLTNYGIEDTLTI